MSGLIFGLKSTFLNNFPHKLSSEITNILQVF